MNDSMEKKTAAATDEDKQAHGLRLWMTCLAIFLISFAAGWEAYGMPVILPQISEDLGTDQSVWILNSLLLVTIAFIPFAGNLASIIGRRPALLIATSLVTLGSILSAVARSLPIMLLVRMLQGIGNAGIFTIPLVIFSDLIPLSQRGRWQCTMTAGWGSAAAFAPLACGSFAFNWRIALWIPVAFLVAGQALLVVFYHVKTPREHITVKRLRPDWIGNLIFVASTTSFVLPLTFAGVQWPWQPAHVIVALILSFIGYGSFVVSEHYLKRPSLPLSILRHRTANAAYLCTGLQTLIFLSFAFYLPIYLEAARLYSPQGSLAMRSLPLSNMVDGEHGLKEEPSPNPHQTRK